MVKYVYIHNCELVHSLTIIIQWILLLSGNKKDLQEQRQVPYSLAQDFADQCGMLDAIETSAKDNTNVEEVFTKLAKVYDT